MKLCYCDESGTGDEPIAVMVGVIVDAQRMHVTKAEWHDLLERLSRVVGRPVTEMHTRDFYAGNDIWRGLPGPERADIITQVFEWLAQRRHHVIYTSVEKSRYFESQKLSKIPREVGSIWRFMGLHLLLGVQRAYQSSEGTKGNTLLVFDNEERERMRFTDLVADPPPWTDSYYARKKKQSRLDQIVDVPYFGDSRDVHLLQLADFLAYFLRRHAEITSGYVEQKYLDEAERVSGWIKILRERSVPARAIYPATGRCDCSSLFYNHAPDVIRSLNR